MKIQGTASRLAEGVFFLKCINQFLFVLLSSIIGTVVDKISVVSTKGTGKSGATKSEAMAQIVKEICAWVMKAQRKPYLSLQAARLQYYKLDSFLLRKDHFLPSLCLNFIREWFFFLPRAINKQNFGKAQQKKISRPQAIKRFIKKNQSRSHWQL